MSTEVAKFAHDLALKHARAEYDAAYALETAADLAFGAAQNAVAEVSTDEHLTALIDTAIALRSMRTCVRAAERTLVALEAWPERSK
jgi:cob(I)alamin adenosyltransferase